MYLRTHFRSQILNPRILLAGLWRLGRGPSQLVPLRAPLCPPQADLCLLRLPPDRQHGSSRVFQQNTARARRASEIPSSSPTRSGKSTTLQVSGRFLFLSPQSHVWEGCRGADDWCCYSVLYLECNTMSRFTCGDRDRWCSTFHWGALETDRGPDIAPRGIPRSPSKSKVHRSSRVVEQARRSRTAEEGLVEPGLSRPPWRRVRGSTPRRSEWK